MVTGWVQALDRGNVKVADRVPVLPSVMVTSLIVMDGGGGGGTVQMPSLCATATRPGVAPACADTARSGYPSPSKSARAAELNEWSVGVPRVVIIGAANVPSP